ncbi:ADP-ribosylation_factor-like protein [Hexamita inflata]|uniref:ADP-ribosylation factor-like protein n=1 Tax=Hexamita inflata TaxID=28002 RepID=A0AA86UF29_9EUKA|nr:ADP-ribosylation factor-like protein [Hexamita inflata]
MKYRRPTLQILEKQNCLVVGMSKSGREYIVDVLQQQRNFKNMNVISFTLYKTMNLSIYRSIYQSQIPLVFVVDSTNISSENKLYLSQLITILKEKSKLLIVATKIDQENSLSKEEISDLLNLDSYKGIFKILKYSGVKSLNEGIKWVLHVGNNL